MGLSDSCLLGIEHLNKQLNEGFWEDSILLFKDVIGAFYQMEKATRPIIDMLELYELEAMTDLVRDSLDHVVGFYEKNEDGKAYNMIEMQLIPHYLNWKKEVERSFTPFTVI